MNKTRIKILTISVLAIFLLFVVTTISIQKIKSMFDNGIIDVSTKKYNERTLSILKTSPDKITFENPDIIISQSGIQEGVFALRNTLEEQHKFIINSGFECYDAKGSDDDLRELIKSNKIITFETYEWFNLKGGESHVTPFHVKISGTSPHTTYMCRISIKSEDSSGKIADYAVKNFTVVYKRLLN